MIVDTLNLQELIGELTALLSTQVGSVPTNVSEVRISKGNFRRVLLEADQSEILEALDRVEDLLSKRDGKAWDTDNMSIRVRLREIANAL